MPWFQFKMIGTKMSCVQFEMSETETPCVQFKMSDIQMKCAQFKNNSHSDQNQFKMNDNQTL